MVGRLVDQQKAVFPREEQAELQLGLLAFGERVEGPPQQLLAQRKRRHLARETPGRHVGVDLRAHFPGKMSGMRHRKGEIVEIHRRVDAPLKRIFPHQQLQKGRLAAAIAADEAQLPAAVELKARLFKNIVVAARIGKAQVGYLDLRHVVSSLKK